MNITITTADVLKNRESVTASGILIDELAYSAGEATQDDVYENSNEIYALDYTIEHYNNRHERDLLNATKKLDALNALRNALELAGVPVKKSKHAGATLALTDPITFAETLDAYRDKCKSEAYSYYDSAFLDAYAADYAKELQEAVDAQQRQDYKEWLHGDYRNYSGVLSLIAKYYGADEALDYNEKTGDSVIFTFDDESIAEDIANANYGEEVKRMSVKLAKEWLIDRITGSIDAEHNKRTAEQSKRKIERERLTVYKAEQAAIDDAARKAKLSALLK